MRRSVSRILAVAGLATTLLAAPILVDPVRAEPTPAALSPHDLALLNRITWGANASSAAEMARMGAKRWLKAQLHPEPGDHLPAQAQAEIDALPYVNEPFVALAERLNAQDTANNRIADPDARIAARQAAFKNSVVLFQAAQARSLLRDLYSQDQLKEQMTWFWMNHFNVHEAKRDIRMMVADYEDKAIRPRALGRFRDLLEATLRHPAMLRYLDNDQNAVGHINENYAREIMELHTMGVGSGYTQQDVQELARILTGVGVSLNAPAPKLAPDKARLYRRDGLFEFNPNRHDFGDKMFLGHLVRGSGYDEVGQALDILAREPATARHVSQKLAVYFMGDDPPASVVDRMAKTFLASDGDIAKVLETLFASREFDNSLGKAFKDPMHYNISAVRAAYDQKVVLNTIKLQGWCIHLTEGLYAHATPDGYPLASAAWNGPTQMVDRFQIARELGANSAGLFHPDTPGAQDLPAFPLLQNTLYFSSLDPLLSAPTRAALGQATSPQDWNLLFLSSPEFMRR